MVVVPPLPAPVAALPIVTSIVVAVGTAITSKRISSKSLSLNPVPVGIVTASNKIISPASAPWAVDVVRVTVVEVSQFYQRPRQSKVESLLRTPVGFGYSGKPYGFALLTQGSTMTIVFEKKLSWLPKVFYFLLRAQNPNEAQILKLTDFFN